MPSITGCLLSRKLVGAVCAMLAILGAMVLHGFFGLTDYLTGAAIATIGTLGGAQIVGQAWIDCNKGDPSDVPVSESA
jgi:hypothetical protein